MDTSCAIHFSKLCLFFHTFFVQVGMIDVALRSLEWALTKEPLRRYEPPIEGQHAFVERPLSVLNVLDAFDLVCNKCGIGWLWLHKPFPTSIASLLARIFVKFTVYDLCIYPYTTFDPALGVLL